jgi:hypothetical protein
MSLRLASELRKTLGQTSSAICLDRNENLDRERTMIHAVVAESASVLKVPISVEAPEKSIVPWAWAMPANVSATRVGPITRTALSSVCFEKSLAHLWMRRESNLTLICIGHLIQPWSQLRNVPKLNRAVREVQ